MTDNRPQTGVSASPTRDPFDLPDISGLTVGVLGGTGEQGRGLAFRWARSGLKVVIGSRDAARARGAALDLGLGIEGETNAGCALASDIVVVAVPWQGHGELLESLRDELFGRIVVDCVNPLGFDKQGAFALVVPDGSAAQQAERLLPDSLVTAAFHHLSAVLLLDPSITDLDIDVFVLGQDRVTTDKVQSLANRLPGVRGIYGGRLRNAHQIEALTANLISVNRRYRVHAGVRVTDV
ncbi:MAG: NADPH-dependent F420 reductase [Actinomycetes bacterium]